MPWNKKKKYQLQKSDKKNTTSSTRKYTKIESKTVSPSSSCSSTISSKGLIRKNEAPSQVKKNSKLKKMI